MTCNETAEFVSALYDGETIPRAAAEHLGACVICKTQLGDYIEMGVELRRVASLELPQEASPRVWSERQGFLTKWRQKGWETMRVPRVAFALLLAGIVTLGSSLTIVGVRAKSQGSAVMLKVALAPGQAVVCPLSMEDKKWQLCGFIGEVNGKMLSYQMKLLSRDGDRIELGLRTKLDSTNPGTHSYLLSDLDTEPERQLWFEPGQTLKVDIAGLEPVEVTGEWMDHVPSVAMAQHQDLDAGPDELRILSPVLLSGKTVLGDLEGMSAVEGKTGAINMYFPGDGLFEVSLSPLEGAVEGRVAQNRISFEMNGRPYAFVTGSPVARSERVWILHDAEYKPAAPFPDSAFMGSSADLNHLFFGAAAKN